jgi:trimeric autotransporter adhesin
MSTKTLRKRIALVAVSALGFGLVSTVPASAVVDANPHVTGTTLSTSSLTVVAASGSSSLMGKFYVDLATNGTLQHSLNGLESDESITVTTIAAPTTVSSTPTVNDLTFQALKTEGTAAAGNPATTTLQIPNATDTYASNNNTYNADATTGTTNRYWFGVYGASSISDRMIDAGEYTVRVRVINGDNNGRLFIDKTLKVKFVSTIGNAGATVTLAQSGPFFVNQVVGFTTANNMTATVADANGGRVQLGKAATGSLASMAPELTAHTVTSAGVVTDTLTASDTGVAGVDHVAPTATASYALGVARQAEGNGVYGIAGTIAAAASVTTVLRVRIPNTSTSVTQAMTILAATTARDIKTDLRLTAAGLAVGEELTKSNVDTTTTYTLPVTTKSAVLRINIDDTADAAVPGASIRTLSTWSGNFATADVTPATQTTATTSITDASGNVDLTITNTNPVAGATYTVVITGFTTGAGTVGQGSRTVVINWAAPVVTTVSVIDPVASIRVLTKSTNVLTVEVADQFGVAMVGQQLQPSLGATDANYSATKTYSVITTGANGTATFSLTDAAAIGADSDTVTFTSVSRSTVSGSYTLSYVTTLPVVATLQAFYDLDATATAPANLVPSTGIYAVEATATRLILKNDRNISKSLSGVGAATTDDMVAYRVRVLTSAGASATGAAVTVKSSDGGWLLDANNLPTMARTFAVPSTGFVNFIGLATKPGAISFTITAGTVSATAAQWVAVPAAAAARTIAISGPATATANGDSASYTVTAKDRYGNAVTGVQLTLSATGVASFAGGATTQSFTTDASGTYTFLGTSTVAAGGAGGFTATATGATDSAMPAGFSGGVAVDATLAAGVATASVAVTFAAGESAVSVAAQAAADAAAEATDAANAATDAANAAAEAADAATAAAQDSADAVAALSTQVSEMVNALKKQITALTNLVIKIQKKVKA